MIGSFLTRGLVMVFGYAYPAYECYKTVEKNKPEIEQLRFWCQYWILVAMLTVFERVGDAFVSWVPMYSEAKLAFFIYLWYPKTRGTTYVYDSFFKPYVAKHENEIDRNLLELRTRAGDMVIQYGQKAASYGQTRVFEVLQYVAAQSTPRPRNPQQQQGPRVRSTTAPNRQPATPQAEPEEPPSPTSSTSSSQHQNEAAEVVNLSKPKTAATASTSSPKSKATGPLAPEKGLRPSTSTEAEAMQTDPMPTDNTNLTPEETLMEETIRVTRGRLRKTRSTGAK